MTSAESVLDAALLFSLVAALSLGLASGLPLRLLFKKKDPRIRFSISLFCVLMSACVACGAAASILLIKSAVLPPYLYANCGAAFCLALVAALFPRSAGAGFASLFAVIGFISILTVSPMARAKPGAAVAWLSVQDVVDGRASIVFSDASGIYRGQLPSSSVEMKARTLTVKGPIGAFVGRRYYRFITFNDPESTAPDYEALPWKLLSLFGFDFSVVASGSLRLAYLDKYALGFDSGMGLLASPER